VILSSKVNMESAFTPSVRNRMDHEMSAPLAHLGAPLHHAMHPVHPHHQAIMRDCCYNDWQPPHSAPPYSTPMKEMEGQ
jgi:hypothetical protein